jgi:hypothetical protein
MTLSAAIAARAAARERHAKNVAAVERGKERVALAQTELDRVKQEDQEAVARHARRMEEAVRASRGGPIPTLTPSDKHIIASLTAERTCTAARQMLASLEAAVALSRAELTQADEAVASAVRAVVAAEAQSMAAQIEDHEKQATRLREQLVALEQSSSVGFAVIAGSPAALTAMRAPGPLTAPRYADGLLLERGPHQARIAAARVAWGERIADLTERGGGEPAPTQEVAA